jgi:alanyl-tRNA synthetase
MTAKEIIDIYISFFEKRGHKQIMGSALVPENDPTTLFTSSGMQPLVPYLLGEQHPAGKRLVDVQNCFRAVDIEEVGDNRHQTFFRMLGNWSLGDYFKAEEIPWLWELLTKEFGIDKSKLYITIFKGTDGVPYDQEAFDLWSKILTDEGMSPDERIFAADVDKNWWSRSGVPANMPIGEIGGPDTEIYYLFEDLKHTDKCTGNSPVGCECGRFTEIANSVFIQYKKTENGFEELPQKNVDYGGGVERLMAAIENTPDVFTADLFRPIIKLIEDETGKKYELNKKEMQVIADHLGAAVFIINSKIKPSNKDQGYVLRRLLRRAFDNFYTLGGENIAPVIEKVVEQYLLTDNELKDNFEEIKLTILEEEKKYHVAITEAKNFIEKRYKGKEVSGTKEISADDAFLLYSTHGLSPTQIRSLGYVFNEQEFANKMEEHQKLSRSGAEQKFKGGLADHSEKTIMGHTATHLLHKALRDMFGTDLHQTGSNITSERVRFDFNFERKLEDSEIAEIEKTVNGKIAENLPVHFEIMPIARAKETGAIGLFDEKYAEDVKVYFIGDYSKELCGGPHVNFTSEIKQFKIIKQENIGHGQRRIYCVVG